MRFTEAILIGKLKLLPPTIEAPALTNNGQTPCQSAIGYSTVCKLSAVQLRCGQLKPPARYYLLTATQPTHVDRPLRFSGVVEQSSTS